MDFYLTNFGLSSNGYVGEDKMTKHLNPIKITIDNFPTLNRVIHEHKPINRTKLSKENLNTKILRNLQFARYNSFEIVIAKDTTSILDLLYYWNRELYQCHSIIYVTVDELLELTKDKYFGGILYDLSVDQTIDVVSFTLTKEEIQQLINDHLNKIAFHRTFRYEDRSNFPFDVLDADGLRESDYGEQSSLQTLLSDENLLFIPRLSFTEKVEFYQQKWAIDIQISQINKPSRKTLNFPLTTDTRFIVRTVNGRINNRRDISFYIHNQQNTSGTVEMYIPEFKLLLHQLIKNPVFQGTVSDTKYINIGPHDSSNRMNSFIKLFNYDLDMIDDFFTDKFWVDLFEDLCKSEKAAGDSISFDNLLIRCISTYEAEIRKLGKKGETLENPENLSLGLQQILKTLCELSVFLQGFKIKCPRCSSIFWYHIKEVGNKVNCKGCLEDYNLPIESTFSYKLNDLIKNNIFQSKTQRDGNLTVIRTLIRLGLRHSNKSFEYSSQFNLYNDYLSKKPTNEIDVVALVDGKLIIGEAKHNSKEFGAYKNKSLDSLIAVAKDIYPDKVVLSCYIDEHGKLESAKKYLEHHFKHYEYAPEIEALLLHQPDYYPLSGSKYFYY
ncbi:hypothetical protein MKJ01_14755 [Chryseobacterium sp. SSA4.19]|uniref:hypothetical protein n=1 Tax=Chryseobacterium sp. SSA4.19 TaxID=2919915 RepID=UPI001F503B57|nr:hypothetical protein [Chryseobacterium sp. SSA4.19]MCJ8155026.1 hypothetical protein [Chryseobacterium sp. SSA4.19]